MKAHIRFLLLFLVLPIFVLCEDTFEDVVKREMCTLKCPADKKCRRTCIETPQKIVELQTQKAEASATLLCRDLTHIILTHNSGPFVIERRLVGDEQWIKPLASTGSRIHLSELLPGRLYEYRFHRVMITGVSKPDIIKPIETFKPNDSIRKVTNISMSKWQVDAEDLYHLRTEISFNPSEDLSCLYEAELWERRNRLGSGCRIDAAEEIYVPLEQLEFDKTYTVEVIATTYSGTKSPKTSQTFTTPSCLEIHKNLTLCAPPPVKGLIATSTHRTGNISVVNVTWDAPDLIPDHYELKLRIYDPDTMKTVTNIPGTSTYFVFPEAEILEQYTVYITAHSAGGRSPFVYKDFSVHEELISIPDGSIFPAIGYIIIASVTSVVSIIGTGVCVYHQHAKRKSEESEKLLSTFNRSGYGTNSRVEISALIPPSVKSPRTL